MKVVVVPLILVIVEEAKVMVMKTMVVRLNNSSSNINKNKTNINNLIQNKDIDLVKHKVSNLETMTIMQKKDMKMDTMKMKDLNKDNINLNRVMLRNRNKVVTNQLQEEVSPNKEILKVHMVQQLAVEVQVLHMVQIPVVQILD